MFWFACSQFANCLFDVCEVNFNQVLLQWSSDFYFGYFLTFDISWDPMKTNSCDPQVGEQTRCHLEPVELTVISPTQEFSGKSLLALSSPTYRARAPLLSVSVLLSGICLLQFLVKSPSCSRRENTWSPVFGNSCRKTGPLAVRQPKGKLGSTGNLHQDLVPFWKNEWTFG